ncbi:MAG: hypothetical protein ACFCUG_05275 [Thiotrichales bacterium]
MEQTWINDALVFVSLGITLVLVVVALRLFFDLRAARKRKHAQLIPRLKLLPDPGDGRSMRVRLKDGSIHDGLTLSGVMDADAARDAGLPHPLNQLVCFDRADGTQVWIDATAIRVLETIDKKG